MTRKLLSLAVASALAGAAGLAPAPAFAQSAEIEALKAQLAALVGEDRTARKGADADQEDRRRDAGHRRQDRRRGGAGKVALSFAGDLRYRNETFDVQYVDRNRNRDRMRARLNANFRVNDTITGVFGIATGGPDPRSRNQTLTDRTRARTSSSTSRTSQWAPNANWQRDRPASSATPGRAPAACSSTVTSIPKVSRSTTPRAISSRGVFYDWLAERALSFSNVTTGTNTDSIMYGAPARLSHSVLGLGAADGRRHVLRLRRRAGLQPVLRRQLLRQHHDHQRRGLQPHAGGRHRLPALGLQHLEGFADLTATVGGQPLRLFVDYAQNTEAEVNPVAGRSWTPRWRAASATARLPPSRAPGNSVSLYQKIEKDALFGQLLDSDFGDGNTDVEWLRPARRLHGGPQLDRQRDVVPQRPVQRRSADGDGVQRDHPGAAMTPR